MMDFYEFVTKYYSHKIKAINLVHIKFISNIIEKAKKENKKLIIATGRNQYKRIINDYLKLVAMRNQPMTDESIMYFGKYKGEKLANVPDHYLKWLLTTPWIQNHPELHSYILENENLLK